MASIRGLPLKSGTCRCSRSIELIDRARPNPESDSALDRLPLLVALDEVQDPHNVGAILRSADAAGAKGVILCKHGGAGLTPAAVKTSAGAAYSMPVAGVSSLSNALIKLKENGFWVAGSDFDKTSLDYRKGLYDRPLVLVIGNEGKGMSKSVKGQCDFKLHIPMHGAVQSLNASVDCRNPDVRDSKQKIKFPTQQSAMKREK